MKKENIIILVLTGICIGLILFMDFKLVRNHEVDEKIKEVISQADSLLKVNITLKEERTILIQQAAQLTRSIDSLSTIRPQNIKHTNNEVSRLYNSDLAGKLDIGDSILWARKQARLQK